MDDRYEFRGAIRDIEGRLRDEGFFRIHKSIVVNLRHVRRMRPGTVELVTGERLDLSRLRASDAQRALMDYVERSCSAGLRVPA